MKKKVKLFSKMLSIFLAIVLMVQVLPMNAIASIVDDITANANSDNILDDIPEQTDTSQTEPKVVAEEISKREQNVKHFRMDDGTYKAVQYESSVHFMLTQKL